MQRSAADIIKILRIAKWPDHLLGEAGYMAMQISTGDTSFLYTLHNGLELAGLFGLEVHSDLGITKGKLWGAIYNAEAALSLYRGGDKWLGFWLAPPLGRVAAEIKAFTRHMELGQVTAPIEPKPRYAGKVGQQYLS